MAPEAPYALKRGADLVVWQLALANATSMASRCDIHFRAESDDSVTHYITYIPIYRVPALPFQAFRARIKVRR